ncbi:MAG: alpha/beta hydrolase-fold protein [Balneolaceae bacterium]
MKTQIILVTFICSLSFSLYAQHRIEDNIVGSSISIQSEVLNDERKIQIFLPDEYDDSDKEYPVLYILDGQRYFLHGVSLHKSLVGFRETPEFIVVGISGNPTDRNRLYSVESQSLRKYLKDEVTTFVDTQYRTSNERIIFGWAYGGGFVVETMITEPDLFDTYIAASPFPLAEKNTSLSKLLHENTEFNKLLFFTSGTNEGVVTEGTTELSSLLTDEAPKTMSWEFKELEGEEHRSTPFTTLYHGLKKHFSYYPELQFNNLDAFSEAGGLDHVYDYYQKRALKYGFPEELSDWTMFSLTRNAIRAEDFEQFNYLVNEFEKTGYINRLRVTRSSLIAQFYLENEQYDIAIELFKLIAESHPNSERPLIGLGDTHSKLGQVKKADMFYNKAEEVSQRNSN